MAQVFGHQAVALDDGKPEEEPTAVGRAPGARELRRAAADRGRRRHDAGTGKRTGHATAAEPPGLTSGRRAGDRGQDGPSALGATEPGPGHRPRAAVHDTAPGKLAGRAALDVAGASGKPAAVHAGPDPVPGRGGGGPEHIGGLVEEQRAATFVGRLRWQSHGRPAGERREPDTRAQHSDHYQYGRRQPAVQRHTRRHVTGPRAPGLVRMLQGGPDQAADVPTNPAVRPGPVPVHRRRHRCTVFVVQRRHVGRVHGVQPDRFDQQRGLSVGGRWWWWRRRPRRWRKRHEARLDPGH